MAFKFQAHYMKRRIDAEENVCKNNVHTYTFEKECQGTEKNHLRHL